MIFTETAIKESATGKIIKIPLSHYKLKEGAVPTIFDGCPSYMNKNISCRETRDEKLKSAEERNLKLAIEESLKANDEYKKNHTFSDYTEFRELLKDPTTEQFEENFLLYARNRFQCLKQNEIHVTLMIDEIHLKPYYDFKAGNIVGKSVNNDKAANAAYVFMLNSFLSNFCDVVHILPVNNIKAEFLFKFIKKVILGLEEIGYRVVCVISDNNSLNGKAMSLFSLPNKLSIVYCHPADPKRPLFFIFDPVHIFKCIRNNWINQKNDGQNMYYLDFHDYSKTKTASFKTIKSIHSLEEGHLLKYAYGISIKALCPTSMERQNVKLVTQIFNDHIVEGLKKLGDQTNELHCLETADFIEIILKWWKIMNVKCSFKGKHKRDKFLEPLTSTPNDEKYIYLQKFLNWLDAWKAANYNSGFLTKETYTALSHTTHAVLELCNYCSDELGFTYVLTGKIQTDFLERRFGKFRQLSGGQYNISIRQVFENECKLRLQSVGPLKIKSSRFGEISVNLTENYETEIKSEQMEYLQFIDINVEEDDLFSLIPILPVITYVAGYCCYSYAKNKKCQLCKDSISINDIVDKFEILDDVENSYILALDRGGLAYPKSEVLEMILHAYVVVQKLISENYEHLFLQMQKQKALTVQLILVILEKKEIFLNENKCTIHSSTYIIQSLVSRAVNTFLNNYCKEYNSNLTKERLFKNKRNTKEERESKLKKRKLQTLSN